MNHWCESCARKNLCYVVDDRPKCFVPITNTASGTSKSYLAKSLRDSHEITKDEPRTIIGERFPSYITMNNAQVLDGWQTNPKTSTTAVEDEPQTEDAYAYDEDRTIGIIRRKGVSR